jgi:hypothetical protein
MCLLPHSEDNKRIAECNVFPLKGISRMQLLHICYHVTEDS